MMAPPSRKRSLVALLGGALSLLRQGAVGWSRTPTPSATPFDGLAGRPPATISVPGSVFNAFVGLYNLWPAPVGGPPAGSGALGPLFTTPGGRRLGDDADEPVVTTRADVNLTAEVELAAAAIVVPEAADAAADAFGLFSRRQTTTTTTADVPAAPVSDWHRRLRALLHSPAVAATETSGGGRRLQGGGLYRETTFDTATPAGRDALFLDGYLTCHLPPLRACVLQRLLVANATGGVDPTRLEPRCCALRRSLPSPADPATLFDVPGELFIPGCYCGGSGHPPPDNNATLTDAQVWERVRASWATYTTQCEELDATRLLSIPTTEYVVPEWCALARWQPHVLATYAVVDPVTVFLPTHGAFERLLRSFPAFWLWLTSLPSCRAGFNRAEYLLRLHSSARRMSCARLGEGDRSTLTRRSLAFQSQESLTLARVRPPGVPLSNSTCLVGNAADFCYPRYAALWWDGEARFADEAGAATVLAQFTEADDGGVGGNGGTGGSILTVIDAVLAPRGHPLMRFPGRNLSCALEEDPDLSLFTALLRATGLLGCLRHPRAPGAPGCPPGAAPWVSRTLYAPVNAAFAKLSPPILAWLFARPNRGLARYIALVRASARAL